MTTETVETPDDQTPEEGEGLRPPPEGDTFPREYVERLRSEAASHRTKAKEATEALEPLQERLHAALVAISGRLADPTDLAFDPAHLEDDALTAAIDALLAAKPHLASRRVVGDVGQGVGEPQAGAVDLGGLLRASA